MAQIYDYYDLTYFQRMVMKITNTYFLCRRIILENKIIANTWTSCVLINSVNYLLCIDKIRKLNLMFSRNNDQ